MLKQLSNLSIQCDGRYAQSHELKFLKDYLNSAEARLKAYEQISQKSSDIVREWEKSARNHPQNLFKQSGRDITDICKRDMSDVLRCAATAMLFNDLDRLREGMLIWYQTIVKSFHYTKHAAVNFRLIQDATKIYLEPAQVDMIMPVFQLQHAVLSN